MSRILRKEGIEKSGSGEPSTLLFSESEEKKSGRQISLVSMTNRALGTWTRSHVA